MSCHRLKSFALLLFLTFPFFQTATGTWVNRDSSIPVLLIDSETTPGNNSKLHDVLSGLYTDFYIHKADSVSGLSMGELSGFMSGVVIIRAENSIDLSNCDSEIIADFIRSGGSVLYCGIPSAEPLTGLLGISHSGSAQRHSLIKGLGPLEGLKLGTSKPLFSRDTALVPDRQSVPILTYQNGACAGSFINAGIYKCSCLGFDPETVTDKQKLSSLLKNTIHLIKPSYQGRMDYLLDLEYRLLTGADETDRSRLAARMADLLNRVESNISDTPLDALDEYTGNAIEFLRSENGAI
ncbi:MAG: hypothetical protein PHQ23_10115 [Candidatus Wallbacteria bacterium]|nr:hypothetical protein [Candidatus Wallbacteria bacterium]